MDPKQGIRILVMVAVAVLVVWGVYLLLTAVPLPEPFRTVLLIILILVVLGVVLRVSGLWP